MDKLYWEHFYDEKAAGEDPTLFAKYFAEKYMSQGQCILELGCGNGRDSHYFAKRGLNVTGLDQCANEIARLRAQCCCERLRFVACDMIKFPQGQYHAIYSRFSLHAVPETTENMLLERITQAITKEGLLAIEVRSTKDELYGIGTPSGRNAFFTTHYRRFIDFQEIQTKLVSYNFELVEANEARGLAPYHNEDPVVIRIIARRAKS